MTNAPARIFTFLQNGQGEHAHK